MKYYSISPINTHNVAIITRDDFSNLQLDTISFSKFHSSKNLEIKFWLVCNNPKKQDFKWNSLYKNGINTNFNSFSSIQCSYILCNSELINILIDSQIYDYRVYNSQISNKHIPGANEENVKFHFLHIKEIEIPETLLSEIEFRIYDMNGEELIRYKKGEIKDSTQFRKMNYEELLKGNEIRPMELYVNDLDLFAFKTKIIISERLKLKIEEGGFIDIAFKEYTDFRLISK
jgi:hypothetical protein